MKLTNCPVCGKRILADSETCPECGFEIKKYLESDAKKDKGSQNIRILIIAVAAVLFMAAAFSIFKEVKALIGIVDSVKHSQNGKIAAHQEEENKQEVKPQSEAEPETDYGAAPAAGVYRGNDSEILVLNNDGKAYYYCSYKEFTELSCPWWCENNQVKVELAKLHCTIFADIKDEDCLELIFKSDSSNWNTEVFNRIDVEPQQYLSREVKLYDQAAALNADGTMDFVMGDICFTLPKQYRDLEDPGDYNPDYSVFIDTDAQTDYVSGILFYQEPYFNDNKDASVMAKEFGVNFLNSVETGAAAEVVVAGKAAKSVEIRGVFNEGFGALDGLSVKGILVMIPDETSRNMLNVLMLETSNRPSQDGYKFEQIISEAYSW